MSEITKLMEGKPSRDLPKDPATSSTSSTSSTVEELLKMLSNSGANKKPPPVPPKPRVAVETMTLEAAKRSLGLIKDDGRQPAARNISTKVVGRDGDEIDHAKSVLKLDAKSSAMKRSDNISSSYIGTSNQTFDEPPVSNPTPFRASAPLAGRIVYDSSAVARQQAFNDLKDSAAGGGNHGVNPIVTEFPDETNNNNYNVPRQRTLNTSSVEILEVPIKHKSTDILANNYQKTYIRTSKQHIDYHHKQSRAHVTPIVTTTTDDEDGDNIDDDGDDTQLPIEEDESILNESSDNHPRTSTPASTQCQLNSSSSSGASTATNNNRSSQNTYLSHGTQDSISEQTDDETLNISKDTDDLANTSEHNQSGCELIGINDNSDSKDSTGAGIVNFDASIKDSYTVQFNDTTMSSSSPPHRINQEQATFTSTNPSPETESLKKLVAAMQTEILKLHTKVSSLTSKVSILETQVEEQKKDIDSHKLSSSMSINRVKQISPIGTMSKNEFSKSASTINRLIPASGEKHDTNYNLNSTFSRNQVATISRNQNISPAPNSNNRLNVGSSIGKNRNTSTQSCNTSLVRPLRKLNIHTSTNSLYADSVKSGSNSISPNSNGQNNRQSISPTSSLTMKRDPMAFNSMLSLSSLGPQGNSGLLKSSGVADSVSNLSQVGSQLSNWPSLSNFIPSKHQAKDILYDEEERVIRMVLYNTLITMRLPSWIEDNYDMDRIVDHPSVRLKLDWVHGYRGRDCRSNIYYLPTGECVYFVASIVVLYNAQEKTQRHYLGHTDSVKCIAIHPNKLIVASGQSAVLNKRDKRPIVRVWNTVSLATLRVIGFNEDFDRSICCLAFSKHDQGATLAVVDESNEHTITLLDWQREKNWRLAEANSGHEPVLAIDFHPIDKYSLVAVGKGAINFWDIRGMTLAKKTGLFDKYDRPKYVLCQTFNDLGETITGDSNGNIIFWPRGSNRPRKIVRDVHQGGVFSVLAMKDGSYLTGGRDRRILEWNEDFMPTGRQAELPEHCGGVRFITYARGAQVLIGTLRNSILMGSLDTNFKLIMQGHTEATTALAVHPNQGKYLTGGFDEQIHLMDTNSHDIEWSKCITMPATAASFAPSGSFLVIGSVQGKWLVLDAITQEILFSACDGSGTISCVKFSPDGEYFCMGSSDCQIYIYQTTEAGNKYFRIGTCVGHSAPVKEIDWSDDGLYIQTQSMNFELLFWRVQSCRPVDDQDTVSDLRWYTHNCSLGFNVLGIWSDSIDSALINHCDKSNNDDLIITATDTGFLNVYRWPACYNQCQSHKYNGNVDKFNFIKFLHDDSKLIAIGSKSCVTTEWTIDRLE